MCGVQAYVGSESEDGQEEVRGDVDTYRALLQGGAEKSAADRWGGKSWAAASSSDEDEVRRRTSPVPWKMDIAQALQVGTMW